MFEKFEKIRQSGLKILSVADISIILSIGIPSARVAATRMVRKGILLRLKRDIYMPFGAAVHDFEIANRLLAPSYVSFESALHHWGIITQIPVTVTSAARRSKLILADGKEFQFCNLPVKLFNIGIVKEKVFFVAGPEKALLDTIYYMSLGKRGAAFDDFNTGKIDKKKFASYLKYYPASVRRLAKGLKL